MPRIALNDVSVLRRPHDRVAELSYRIAGEEVGHVRCDGLVAATPVGSTGSHLANQGPVLARGGGEGRCPPPPPPPPPPRPPPRRRPRRRPPHGHRGGRGAGRRRDRRRAR